MTMTTRANSSEMSSKMTMLNHRMKVENKAMANNKTAVSKD